MATEGCKTVELPTFGPAIQAEDLAFGNIYKDQILSSLDEYRNILHSE